MPKHVIPQVHVVKDISYPPRGGDVRDTGHWLRKSDSQPVPEYQVSGTNLSFLCDFTQHC